MDISNTEVFSTPEKRSDFAQHVDKQMSNLARYQNGDVTIFENATIIDVQGYRSNSWVAVRGGIIERTGSGAFSLAKLKIEYAMRGVACRVVDVADDVLCPGFIDIHAHGGWGSAFDDGNDAISMARAFHISRGTTRQVLSLITSPWDELLENVRTAAVVAKRRADVLGLHLEGPFISPKRKGAHDEMCLLEPSEQRVNELLDAAQGTLLQVTIAPELPGSLSAIEQLAHAGVVPAIGHTNANYEQALVAVNHGARIVTHMFNAMNPLLHRAPGPIAAAVECGDVTAELIADGFHIDVPTLRAGVKMMEGRIALVTDAMAAAGCADGEYKLGNLDVSVKSGKARLAGTDTIAGSTLTLDEAVRRMVFDVVVSRREAIAAATYAPARALGLDKSSCQATVPLGMIAQGYAADVLVLDADSLKVKQVWCEGEEVSYDVEKK